MSNDWPTPEPSTNTWNRTSRTPRLDDGIEPTGTVVDDILAAAFGSANTVHVRKSRARLWRPAPNILLTLICGLHLAAIVVLAGALLHTPQPGRDLLQAVHTAGVAPTGALFVVLLVLAAAHLANALSVLRGSRGGLRALRLLAAGWLLAAAINGPHLPVLGAATTGLLVSFLPATTAWCCRTLTR